MVRIGDVWCFDRVRASRQCDGQVLCEFVAVRDVMTEDLSREHFKSALSSALAPQPPHLYQRAHQTSACQAANGKREQPLRRRH